VSNGEHKADRGGVGDADTAHRSVDRRVTGTVVHGEKRGRELGFPTANIRLGAEAAEGLAYGVYSARVLGHAAAVSIGVRPTFGDGLEPLLEAHIIDFAGDLYGREITVELLDYVRPELRFTSVDQLVEQMDADIATVRETVGAAG
jgi:riboflavin kinase/FMN adenylyltransferase